MSNRLPHCILDSPFILLCAVTTLQIGFPFSSSTFFTFSNLLQNLASILFCFPILLSTVFSSPAASGIITFLGCRDMADGVSPGETSFDTEKEGRFIDLSSLITLETECIFFLVKSSPNDFSLFPFPFLSASLCGHNLIFPFFNLLAGANMVFRLSSEIVGRRAIEKFVRTVQLYELDSVQIEIVNPFPVESNFLMRLSMACKTVTPETILQQAIKGPSILSQTQ